MTAQANITDDDIRSSSTEPGPDRDKGGEHGQDSGGTGPTEDEDDRDQGGEGERDTGDEA